MIFADEPTGALDTVSGNQAPDVPEAVAPAVVWLCSEQVQELGLIVEAAGGRFNLARFVADSEVDLGTDPTVEAFARWKGDDDHRRAP